MTLIVDESLSVPGAVCQRCLSLQLVSASSGGECLYCGGPLREIENIASRVVVEAFRQRCKIMFLETDELREEAAEFGRIGALLRFAVEVEPAR
jgi:peptide subunit release factor 1 (eRF1)